MICKQDKIYELIKKANDIALVCHANPDGDTLGSGLALFFALKKAGRNAEIFCADAPKGKLATLCGAGSVRTDVPSKAFDLAIAIDCSDINLLASHAYILRKARVSACVDHHVSNNDYADFTFVERGVAAAAQPVYKLIKLILKEKALDLTIAELLYTALVTDSGVRGDKIIEFFMRDVRPEVFALATRVLNKAEFFEDGKIGLIIFSQEDFEATGTDLSDTTGIINNIRDVEGVFIAVSLTQAAKNEYKVSIRTDEHADANRIAAVFGGGGHARAAGCRTYGYFEDVKEKVLKACRDHLE